MTEKYRDKGLVVLAVNIVPPQDEQVVPFFKKNGYTFTPYKANPEMADTWGVSGAPTEYVVDRQARVVAKVRLASDDLERRVGELIERLLAGR